MTEELPERLRKLKALADHPNTPPHEAAAARSKLLKALKKLNLTEEDVTGERVHRWGLPEIQTHEKTLFEHVVSMILDKVWVPVEWTKYSGGWAANVLTTILDKIDIEAAFGWYRKCLHKDRYNMKQAIKEQRAEIKTAEARVKILKKGMGSLPDLLIGKHMIYPPSIVAQAEAEVARTVLSDEPVKEPTQKELEEQERRNAHRRAARQHMSPSETWQKADGLGSVQQELSF